MSPSKPAPNAPEVFLALGSNLGDRRGFLGRAAAELRRRAGAGEMRASSLYETPAVGIAAAPDFLNAVLRLRTPLGPLELLRLCHQIEADCGRPPRAVSSQTDWRSRTLDIDLLLYGDLRLAGPELILPHPRIRERPFVLEPLAELAPDVLLEGRPVAEWAREAGQAGIVRWPKSAGWADTPA